MAQVGRTDVRERRACATKDFARDSVARASGDNTMEEIYENEESEAIYREARARKGPHIERYPVAQIPVRLEHAAGRGEGRSAPTAGGIASVLAFHQSSRDGCARVHSSIA